MFAALVSIPLILFIYLFITRFVTRPPRWPQPGPGPDRRGRWRPAPAAAGAWPRRDRPQRKHLQRHDGHARRAGAPGRRLGERGDRGGEPACRRCPGGCRELAAPERELGGRPARGRNGRQHLVDRRARAEVVRERSHDSLERSREGQRSLERLVDEVGEVEAAVRQMADAVVAFVDSTQAISRMTSEVRDRRADQPARAQRRDRGRARRRAGRGFAVVADEVRKLAEKSARSAGEIDQITREVAGARARCAARSTMASVTSPPAGRWPMR